MCGILCVKLAIVFFFLLSEHFLLPAKYWQQKGNFVDDFVKSMRLKLNEEGLLFKEKQLIMDNLFDQFHFNVVFALILRSFNDLDVLSSTERYSWLFGVLSKDLSGFV